MIQRLFTLLPVSLLVISTAHAQSFTARVIDQQTEEPIPFATVITGENQGVIANEEGVFNVNLDGVASDSLYLSSMGYEKKGISIKSRGNIDIALKPKTFELKEVFLNARPLSAEEIIEMVKQNLQANYAAELTKKKIFFRQTSLNYMNKVDFGFQKSTIAELNKKLMDSIARIIPKESAYYREVVADLYGDYKLQKLYIDRAAELYDKSKDLSMDGLSEQLEGIFNENVKPDSYLKIKSGLFGTKVQLDSAVAANEEAKDIKVEVEEKEKGVFHGRIMDQLDEVYQQLFFQEDTKIDILEKSNRYDFTLNNYTFIDDAPVYIINFSPKGGKDFKGVMYVNTQDFAIMRLEFENVRPIKNFKLLGITYRNNVFRGKMLFGKDNNGAYSPRYLELEDGSFFGINRPLKVIEKNKHVKGRSKQNELALELDIQTTEIEKYELVVFTSESSTSTNFDGLAENKKIEATYLSQYDPNFWEGYSIMEPNAAIQAFKAISE